MNTVDLKNKAAWLSKNGYEFVEGKDIQKEILYPSEKGASYQRYANLQITMEAVARLNYVRFVNYVTQREREALEILMLPSEQFKLVCGNDCAKCMEYEGCSKIGGLADEHGGIGTEADTDKETNR